MFSKEGFPENIINKPSSQGHWSVCASFWRSFSCPFCRPSLLYGTHLPPPKSTRLGFQLVQPYLDKPSSSRSWKSKMSGLHWAKIVYFILLNSIHRSGVWRIWERTKKGGEGEGCSSLNEVASAPGARFLKTPGLQAFEIVASLVEDVVEENSFSSKALKVNVAENCCSRFSTENSDRNWLGLPLWRLVSDQLR